MMNKPTPQGPGSLNHISVPASNSPVNRGHGRGQPSSYQDVSEPYYQHVPPRGRGDNWSQYGGHSSSSRGYHNNSRGNPHHHQEYGTSNRSPGIRMDNTNYARAAYGHTSDYRYDGYSPPSRGGGNFNYPSSYGGGRGQHYQYEHSEHQHMSSPRGRGSQAVRGGNDQRNITPHTVPIEHHYVPVRDGNTSPHGNHSPQHGSPGR